MSLLHGIAYGIGGLLALCGLLVLALVIEIVVTKRR